MAGQPATLPSGSSSDSDHAALSAAEASSRLSALPVHRIKGIGEKTATLFTKIGIATVYDLLTTFPRRYEDRSQFRRIVELQDGEAATIIGKVTSVENRPTKNQLTLTRVTLDDGQKGVATLVWFNQWRLKQQFEKRIGKQIAVYGTVKRGYNAVELTSPDWEDLDDSGTVDSLAIGRIVPVYGLTEGLSQKVVRRAVAVALDNFAEMWEETLPAAIRADKGMPAREKAVRQMHFPESWGHLEAARRRLAYEELLVVQLALAQQQNQLHQEAGIAFADTARPLAELGAALPFSLTGAQQRAMEEIAADMQSARPMNRLVQGDVGAGKTVVAMGALLIAVRNGYQAALMAPTEILAEQHFRGISRTLGERGVRVELLTGSRAAAEKRQVRERVAAGEADVVIGTHALIQEGVAFHRLGMAVVDEQHRFGVLQRAALSGKGANPDILVMTATPIPRTLTLTVYGDLDVSIIDELPPGRKPIRTHWKKPAEKNKIYDGVRQLIEAGRQAYVVCPLVEESDKLTAQAATELASHLRQHVFPEFSVGLLHGQMPPAEKDDMIRRFRENDVQILVSTTVIEVGVDVPNAVVMVIEDADRFGLAQLHQLRGRVGRGSHASYCVLIADPKSADGVERMQVMTVTNDGFVIAEEDLRLRGPGDFFGVRQSGIAGLKVANLVDDMPILREAREDARAIVSVDPKLTAPENRALNRAVQQHRRAVELARVG
ncbi:MAG: ATP-dependent DNA helicase RecG [Armatimonadaceae bacterium]